MNIGKILSQLLVLSLFLVSTSTLASGSYRSKSSSRSSPQETYNYGKLTINKKLLCAACSLSNVTLNDANAKKLIEQVNQNSDATKMLSQSERKAVVYYLNKRFNIQ